MSDGQTVIMLDQLLVAWLCLLVLIGGIVGVQRTRLRIHHYKGRIRGVTANKQAQLRMVNTVFKRLALLSDLPFIPPKVRMGLQLTQWLGKR
jgi:hypothetical protein